MRVTSKFSIILAFCTSMVIFATFTLLSQAGLREDLGMVALWTLDEDTINKNIVNDAFEENEGTIGPKSVRGFLGEALDFDGAVDLIRMTNDIFFPSVTMEALIKPALGTRNPIYDK